MISYNKNTAKCNTSKEIKTKLQQTTANFSKLVIMIVIAEMTWILNYLYWRMEVEVRLTWDGMADGIANVV